MNKLFVIVLIHINCFCNAQVSNDSCLSAHDIGMLPPGSITTMCFDGSIHIGFIDSTDFAAPNFPYPTIPNSCMGYTSNVAISGKDVWYKCQVNCDITIRIENSDTLHLSVWLGDTCSMLMPIGCFTVPAGASNMQTISNVGSHTIYLQFSGQSNLVDTRFTFCVATTGVICVPVFNSAPTPVTCMEYSVQMQNSTDSINNNGAINIVVNNGNGPFSCTWADNFNGFNRSNLSAGTYIFSITDANGCTQIDSVVISVITDIISISKVQYSIIVKENHLLINFRSAESHEKQILIYDYSGRLEKTIKSYNEIIDVELGNGIHLLRIFDGLKWTINKITI